MREQVKASLGKALQTEEKASTKSPIFGIYKGPPSPSKWSGSGHILMKREIFTERQETGRSKIGRGRTQEFWTCWILEFYLPIDVYVVISGGAVEIQSGIQGRSQSWSCTFVSHHHIS